MLYFFLGGRGEALLSFIEQLQGHLGADQAAAGGGANRQAGGCREVLLLLPVLEELLEDGTLTTLFLDIGGSYTDVCFREVIEPQIYV